MDMSEMNRRAGRVLEEWGPLAAGSDGCQTEIAEVLKELETLDHPSELGRKIQHVYADAFGKWIPLEDCVEVSYKLLALKYEAKHII
ncbi:DUF1871 family protein [Planomicrobium sp. YIM 101495]|uniref:DUF1871 family protein n=1 Tax=Planomicrobium sp. YIM 101495 TaxID=2665160 RepID=UPI0012BA023F|nr:DUF1871 family protein [Planomicrobium sp. YIM 101495]MTD31811.1 DUF1871 family protein [Planomicrobium sp. YIM 101495]